MLINLRQNEAELDKMSDDSSDLIQISGESRFSVSVQQVTSRFQSIQTTAKVIYRHVIFDSVNLLMNTMLLLIKLVGIGEKM